MFRKTREFCGLWPKYSPRSSFLLEGGGAVHNHLGVSGPFSFPALGGKHGFGWKLVLDQRRQGGRQLDRSRIHFEVLGMVVVFGLMALTGAGLWAILSAWKTGLVE